MQKTDFENVTEITHFKAKCAEIVTRLIEIRKQSGTTQDHAADIFGVSRKKINEFEGGSFDFDLFLKYCHYFSVDLNLTYTIN